MFRRDLYFLSFLLAAFVFLPFLNQFFDVLQVIRLNLKSMVQTLIGVEAYAAAAGVGSSFAGLSEDGGAAINAGLNKAEIIKNKTKLLWQQFMICLLKLV